MRKPSVLLMNRVYAPDPGATGRLLRDLAQAFAVDGWNVNIVTTGSKSERYVEKGVTIQTVAAKPRQTVPNYLFILAKLFFTARKAGRPDLIVTMTDPPLLAVAGYFLSHRRKIAHIHWCQDVYPDLLPVVGVKMPKFLMKFFRAMTDKAIQHSTKLVAIGGCMANKLARTGIDPRRITVIHNWPDSEFTIVSDGVFHNDKMLKSMPTTEKPLLINTAPKFRVLYAGNLGRAHSVTTILDAAAILQLSHPEIEFLFVGKGLGHDRVAKERLRRNLENIKLLPPQPVFQLRYMMQSGDIHLISLKNEAAGLVVPSKLYSALAAERPCILVGPENCETAKVINDYKLGKVIAPGNALGLAEAIIQYRTDGSKWFEAHQGAMRAADDFSADKSIASWITCARTAIRYPTA